MIPAEAVNETETDTGPGARRAGTERLCIVSRTVKPIGELIRFVLGPDGAVVPDLRNRLPGRGVWVSADRQAVRQAAERGAFARGFRRPVKAPAGLADDTERLLGQAVADAAGMAQKAGLLVAGFTKVEAALEARLAIAVIEAQEAAPDGVRKLAAAARRGSGGTGSPIPVVVLPQERLDLALGRANVIHAALLAGPASEALLARYRRLETYRGGEPAKLAEKRE